ncbi:MAG: response regulator [Planctomycetota bacterium]
MRILIVDDDYISRTKLKTILEEYGDCDASPTGEIALKMFVAAHKEKLPYNLITMDLSMPDVNGIEVVKRIRMWEKDNKTYESEFEAKIFMITADQEAKNIVNSFKSGCEWHIQKPVSPEKIREGIKEIELGKD